MKRLYLIRHAQPTKEEHLTGDQEADLSKEGRSQARDIGHFLLGKNIEQLWSSTSVRVKQTVEPLLKEHPMHLGYCEALNERMPELESRESLERRIHDWWEERRGSALQQNTAIFAHCGSINMLLEYEDPDKEKLSYSFEDEKGCYTPVAGIWELHFDESGTLQGGALQDYEEK